jgi:predicted ATPase/class 3 adenylate cyclase/DNA-binding XRE family transcriptional regulator
MGADQATPFGEALRRYRRAVGLTQEELAERAGLSARTVSDLERGINRSPRKDTLPLLAEALGLTAEERRDLEAMTRRPGPVSTPPTPGAIPSNLPLPPLLGREREVASGLPAGLATFLFTDIEGSTMRWEQQPSAMRAALARHDALLHDGIATHGGVVLTERGEGDSFFALFARPSDALAAACALQRALVAERWPDDVAPLRVRMAVHTGEAAMREGSDYRGAAVNRCARLRAASHGGQVLLSAATYELVCDHLPSGASLCDLGAHRLKDLTRPEHIFQLVHPDLQTDFPPLRTLDSRATNLPAQPTAFLGRESELAQLQVLLRRPDVRLVSLIGPGGTGKTRLALQLAAELLDDFAQGVYFVDLAPVADPHLAMATIATTLGLHESGGRTLADLVGGYLTDRALLLVLDNFERVLPAAPAVSALLASCPRLKVLVTSRAVLRLYGEQEYAVSPLPVPRRGALPSPTALGQYAAVALFLARAQLVQPDFALTAETAPAVAEICRRLDGLPLALELAAARIKVFSPQALLARLSGEAGRSSLRVLTDGGRDLPARLQTMRSAIAWSYDLLNEAEQAVFRRMAVFEGGWRLVAAEEICRTVALPAEHADVLELLASLVDKSLVLTDESPDGEPRFTMLETIRDYGWECLQTRGELQAVQRQYALHCLALVEAVEPALTGPDQATLLAYLEREHGNLRAALRWAVQTGEAAIGLRLAAGLWRFWQTRGHLTEGRAWLEAMLALPLDAEQEADLASARSMALNGLGVLCDIQGDQRRAGLHFEQSLALRRQLGDRTGIANSLTNLGIIADYQGNYDRATDLYEESLAIRRETADISGMAATLHNLGIVARNRGEYERAAALFEEGLALQRQLDNMRGIALALNNLAAVARCRGDLPHAADLARSSLLLFEELGDTWGLVLALGNLAGVACDRGDLAQAADLFRQGLSHFEEVGPTAAIIEDLEGLASVVCKQGLADHAVLLLGAASAQREAMGLPLAPADRGIHERTLMALRSSLQEDSFVARWQEGRGMSLERAIALAGATDQ